MNSWRPIWFIATSHSHQVGRGLLPQFETSSTAGNNKKGKKKSTSCKQNKSRRHLHCRLTGATRRSWTSVNSSRFTGTSPSYSCDVQRRRSKRISRPGDKEAESATPLLTSSLPHSLLCISTRGRSEHGVIG